MGINWRTISQPSTVCWWECNGAILVYMSGVEGDNSSGFLNFWSTVVFPLLKKHILMIHHDPSKFKPWNTSGCAEGPTCDFTNNASNQGLRKSAMICHDAVEGDGITLDAQAFGILQQVQSILPGAKCWQEDVLTSCSVRAPWWKEHRHPVYADS